MAVHFSGGEWNMAQGSAEPLPTRSLPAPKKKTYTFRIGPKGMDAEEARLWQEAMTSYENLAEQEEIAQNAVKFVGQIEQWHGQKMLDVYEQWQDLDEMLRGTSLSQMFPGSDLHIPELHTAVETLVPMIVDAIRSYRPWFHIIGRDRMDRARAKRLEQWLLYLLDKENFDARVEPIIRDMLIYKFFALKTRWSVEFRKQIVRDVEKTYEKGLPKYRIRPKEEEVKSFEGVRFDQIDPYDFIIDLTAIDPQRASFIGDRCVIGEDQFLAMQDSAGFVNVEQALEEKSFQPARWQSELAKYSRSLDATYGMMTHRRAQGEPRKVCLTEIWARWQPKPGHEFEEYVITVANGRVAVRVQKNPYDDKHRPYVVGRSSKSSHDFINVGVLDHAARLNTEMDDHTNLAMKSHANSVSPIILVDGDAADASTGIWDIEPGAVRSIRGTPHILKMPATLGEMSGMAQMLRTWIEEATGAYRIHESPSTTATEVERKVQTRNMRARQLVINASDGFVQLLTQCYSLSQQFVTQATTYRVMGGQAGTLGIDYRLSPEDLGDPVDFVIKGVEGLQSYGLRTTQMATVLNQFGPLLAMMVQNGNLDPSRLFQEAWNVTVGYRLGEDILRVDDPIGDMLDPHEENIMLMEGVAVDVHEADDDDYHDQVVSEFIAEHMFELTPDALKAAWEHKLRHQSQKARKAQREKAAGNPLAKFRSGAATQLKEPGTGRYDQEPDLMGDAPQQTVPGETPGPPRAGSTPAPDRAKSVPQTANR